MPPLARLGGVATDVAREYGERPPGSDEPGSKHPALRAVLIANVTIHKSGIYSHASSTFASSPGESADARPSEPAHKMTFLRIRL
jgi:hypothetical protein